MWHYKNVKKTVVQVGMSYNNNYVYVALSLTTTVVHIRDDKGVSSY